MCSVLIGKVIGGLVVFYTAAYLMGVMLDKLFFIAVEHSLTKHRRAKIEKRKGIKIRKI
jgi:hypothetical protein